jgi:hypothetical protein
MKLFKLKGSTSQSEYVYLRHATTGAPLPGLAYNTSGLSAYYVRPLGSPVAITLATLANAQAAYSSGGFVEVSAANMPGVYRFDIPMGVFATGVNQAVVILHGAPNLDPCALEYQLTGIDIQDAVRMGMTALPNAAAGAAGGLLTCTTGNVLPANSIVAASMAADVSTEIVAALEATVGEEDGSYTYKQMWKTVFAVLAGRTSGGNFSTPNNGSVRAAFTYTGNDRTGVVLTPDA